MALPDIEIGSRFDAKGFKQAETAATKLEKNVKSLAKSFVGVFAAQKVLAFGKASVKAFAEDDAAAKSLGQTLKNLGLAYGANVGTVNGFINRLEMQTGILDDELRPALDRILRATGDVTKSQELLSLALDIAAGTGKSVTQVSQSLQKAYLGQTQALGRLGVGLSKAELASSDFEQIQARLADLFAGQATRAADSYQGSLNKLQVAANNAKETIGKGLVDALGILSSSSTVDPAVSSIDRIANSIADATKNVAKFIAVNKTLFSDLSFFRNDATIAAALAIKQGTSFTTPMTISSQDTQRADKAAAAAAQKVAADKIKADKLIASNKIKADKLAAANKAKLDKASAVFNMQNIQISAALKGKISEEEKTRLLLMQAIADEDATKAEKLQKKLEEIQAKNAEIAKSLTEISTVTDPFAAWATSLGAAATVLKAMPALINASGGLTGRGTHNIPTGDGLPVSGETAGVTVIVPTAGAATGATAPINPILGGTTSIPAAIADIITSAAAEVAADPVITAVVSDSVVTAITDGITEAASGTGGFGWSLPSYITDTFATGIVDSIGESLVAASNIGSTGGFGFSLPGYLSSSIPTPTATPVVINVTNTGSVIMQDEFVTAVADALITANTNGNNNYRPGAILIDG